MKVLLNYVKNFVLMISIGIGCSVLVDSCSMDFTLGTMKQRHDFIKSIIGNLDDVVVTSGLISDTDLHKIGAMLGICTETPGGLD